MSEEHGALGRELRRATRGRVLMPGDPGFETAASPWDRSARQDAGAVVEITDARDAAAVVACARLAGLSVAARPSGRGAARALEGAILVRTGALRGVEVDADRAVARLQAGARWDDVLAAAPHGLTGLCGSSSAAGAVGHLLGGGLGWYGRRHGPAAGSIRAAEVIDAEGGRHRVTPDGDPELMWALRGGGGDFALVTALEIDLYPAPELYGGRMLWPASRARRVLAAFREVSEEAPEELTVRFGLLERPGSADGPLAAIDLVHLGAADAGRTLTRIFEEIPGRLGDTRGPMSPAGIGRVCAEPALPSPLLRRGELFAQLTETVAEELLDAAGRASIAPLAAVQVRHLGGALARPVDGACGSIAEPYGLAMLAAVSEPGALEAARARQDEIAAALTPYSSGRKPFSFLRGDEQVAVAFPATTLSRLRDIKRRRDPHGVFRGAFPVLG